MNHIAGVEDFNFMNNLRLVIIVAIFIGIIFVILLNKILGSRKRVKRKHMQTVNPYDDSSREERHAPGVVDDFFGMEESIEKEKSKDGESTAEPEVETEGQSVVNYEKIEANLKAIMDEVTTKIEGLISKVDAVEKEVLSKIENIIDVKIQEASNKINDRIAEVLRTQRNSNNPVADERVDFLRKEEVPAYIVPSEDTVVPEEINGKEQTDTIVPSGEIEKNISEGDLGESVDFDIQKLLEEEPVGVSSSEESKELVEEEVEFEEKEERDLEAPVEDNDIVENLAGSLQMDEDPFGVLLSDESKSEAEEKKGRDLEVPDEVKKDVKVDEKEPIETIASTGEIEENISEGDLGESVDFDIEKLLEEEPVGTSFTDGSREEAEEKDEFKEEENEPIEPIALSGDVEEKVSEKSVGESVDFDIEKLLEEEPVGISFTDESKEEVKEKVEESKPTETITPPEDIKEKALEAAKGEEAEERKQSTGETVDFDIQAFLEELGTPPSEKG